MSIANRDSRGASASDPVNALIDRTDNDLERVRSFARAPHEIHRILAARADVAQFRQQWNSGTFGDGELAEAIAQIRIVVNRNLLDAHDRDRLVEDLARLQDLRTHPPRLPAAPATGAA